MFSVGARHKGRRVTAQNRSNTLYLLRDHLGGDSDRDDEEDDGDDVDLMVMGLMKNIIQVEISTTTRELTSTSQSGRNKILMPQMAGGTLVCCPTR